MLTFLEKPPATYLHSGLSARSRLNDSAAQAFHVTHDFLLAVKHKEQKMAIQVFSFQASYLTSPSNVILFYLISPSNVTLLFPKANS